MAVSKCFLCNRRLRGGEGKYKMVNGKAEKVCVDERTCRLRREMYKKSEDEDDGGGAETRIYLDWRVCAAIIAGILLAALAGVTAGILMAVGL